MASAYSNAPTRVVVKFGTQVVLDDAGALAVERMDRHVEAIANAIKGGAQVILVSSGAVGMGRTTVAELRGGPLEASSGENLNLKQAFASVGQSRLMNFYERSFARYGLATGQLLLTEEDFSDRKRYLNLRHTVLSLLALGVAPIINENDSVATEELALDPHRSFGDNDKLSALVASKLEADQLILLSDVDGLYEENPRLNPNAKRIERVAEITPEIKALAKGVSGRGRGGMATKLEAARVGTKSGATVWIASGRDPSTLPRIFAGEQAGTRFAASTALPSRKRWIGFASGVAGTLIVNARAAEAVTAKKASLLPVGVIEVRGEFGAGDVVAIADESGKEIGRGIVNYDSRQVASMKGRSSEDNLRRFPTMHYDAVVTRDNLVLK